MHEYTSRARVWGLTCPGLPEEVSRARRWTRDILRGSPMADDAAVIVSELSSNAVLHTASGRESGSFHLAVAVTARVVALSVTDAGGTDTAPEINRAGDGATNGRGLHIVNSLAHQVVVHDSDGGRTVTAELFAGPHRAGRPW
ncbi:ATP-binding protein [Streptomyces sp. NPDC048057]|uniref:ATP-binding protein n=1 Tax=Streptomyces sp. NPDC048057 TaxID=3155628 RepID=UPI0033E156D9